MKQEPSIPWASIRATLIQWVAGVTGVEARWGNQAAAQPSYPFASLLITAGTLPLGALDEERWRADGGVTVVGQRDFTLSVQIHAGQSQAVLPDCDAVAMIHELINSTARPDVKDRFREVGLSLRERGTPAIGDVVVGTEWISIQNIDFRFGLASNVILDPQDTGYFEKVEITSNIEGFQNEPSGLEIENEIIGPV